MLDVRQYLRRPQLPIVVGVCALLFVLSLSLFVAAGFQPVILALGLLVVLSTCVYIAVSKDESRTASDKTVVNLFAAAVAILGLANALIFTPFTTNDEDYHFAASYAWSNVAFSGYPSDRIRVEDVSALTDSRFEFHQSAEAYTAVGESLSVGNISGETTTITEFYSVFRENIGDWVNGGMIRKRVNIASNPIQLKLPSALAIATARAFNLGPIPLFFLGRVANVIFVTFLLWMAVKITPIGKTVMMGISLLPMTTHLIGSYSYDGITLGYAFLLLGFIFRSWKAKGDIRIAELVSIGLMGFLLAPCKTIYSLLVFLVVLIPNERFGGRGKSILSKVTVIAVTFVGILAPRFVAFGFEQVAIGFTGSTGDGGVASNLAVDSVVAGGSKITIGWAFTHPIDSMALFLNSIKTKLFYYVSSLLGMTLAWYEGRLSSVGDYLSCSIAVLFFLSVLLASFLPTVEDAYVPSGRERLLMLAIFFVVVLGTFAALMFSWSNPLEKGFIDGVQGRYFLPVLPLAALSLRFGKLPKIENLAPTVITLMSVGTLVFIGYVVFVAFA